MNTLSDIVMIFNNQAWDFVTKYVYQDDSLKRLFNYCTNPLQDSEEKSVFLYLNQVYWSSDRHYVKSYMDFLSVLSEESSKDNNFKYYICRTENASENCDLVGNYADHRFFKFNWDGCEYDGSNNWIIYSPFDVNKLYHSSLDSNSSHRINFEG